MAPLSKDESPRSYARRKREYNKKKMERQKHKKWPSQGTNDGAQVRAHSLDQNRMGKYRPQKIESLERLLMEKFEGKYLEEKAKEECEGDITKYSRTNLESLEKLLLIMEKNSALLDKDSCPPGTQIKSTSKEPHLDM